ncbi:helix-turn-helix transcriptional regulator [Dickeya undicola]|uniref:helix-turn-helix transcriptional regulator n=1 Tax=Dickeya undicola TaxID=1577887 RepID=UPI000532E7CC|nr:AraC family transcriptional regulator [Dickeya undicola]
MRNHVPSSASIYKNQIMQMSSLVANHYRFLGPQLIDETPLLFGHFNVTPLHRDLILHTADVINLHNMQTQTTLNGALKLAIVVNGNAHISYGERRLHLGERQPASLVSLTEPTLFSRYGKRDDYERTVSLTFSREWLYGNLMGSVDNWQSIYDFTQTHLATHRWMPSRQALAAAWQILNTGACQTPLQRLYLETQCMTLIIEAFSSLTEQASISKQISGLPLRHQQRMQQVKEMLESGEADHLAIVDIAKSVNMSESSLQRYFRQTFDMTVFEYLRNCRLQRAVLAMQREGVGIAQAASLAGYTSPANFATALRRVYGLTPGQLKNRV